jgi:hypothetical protein
LLKTLLALLVGFPVLALPVAFGFWVTTLLNPFELLCTDWYWWLLKGLFFLLPVSKTFFFSFESSEAYTGLQFN